MFPTVPIVVKISEPHRFIEHISYTHSSVNKIKKMRQFEMRPLKTLLTYVLYLALKAQCFSQSCCRLMFQGKPVIVQLLY